MNKLNFIKNILAEAFICTRLKFIYFFIDQKIRKSCQKKTNKNGNSVRANMLFVFEGVLQIAHDGSHPMKHPGIAVPFIKSGIRKAQVLDLGAQIPESELILRAQGTMPVNFINDR
ncbi:hypothetical protein NTGM5_310011 [Candidatus Nitrotoga sp. M5]|nr:hypothetical protein NTGM5_310011 [Candidatus Nitrotoga sp. M5]